MIIKKTLGSIVLAGALVFGGCSKEEAKPEYKNVTGKIYQLDQQELIYVHHGFGSSNNIPIPITFLGVEAESKKYQIILTGPHNLKQGDSIGLDYLIDNEVTATEIWNRFYPEKVNSSLIKAPNVKFKADGYATAWKKE